MRLGISFWIVIWAFFGVSDAFAQSADSLLALLKRSRTADTTRVNLLYDYAWEIADADTEAAESYFKEALALAQSLKFDKGVANALNGLGVVAEIRGDYDQPAGSTDRLPESAKNSATYAARRVYTAIWAWLLALRVVSAKRRSNCSAAWSYTSLSAIR